jgi:histidine ammonia-lyase
MIVELDGTSLRAADVERIARGQAAVRVTETGRRRIRDASVTGLPPFSPRRPTAARA